MSLPSGERDKKDGSREQGGRIGEEGGGIREVSRDQAQQGVERREKAGSSRQEEEGRREKVGMNGDEQKEGGKREETWRCCHLQYLFSLNYTEWWRKYI